MGVNVANLIVERDRLKLQVHHLLAAKSSLLGICDTLTALIRALDSKGEFTEKLDGFILLIGIIRKN